MLGRSRDHTLKALLAAIIVYVIPPLHPTRYSAMTANTDMPSLAPRRARHPTRARNRPSTATWPSSSSQSLASHVSPSYFFSLPACSAPPDRGSADVPGRVPSFQSSASWGRRRTCSFDSLLGNKAPSYGISIHCPSTGLAAIVVAYGLHHSRTPDTLSRLSIVSWLSNSFVLRTLTK